MKKSVFGFIIAGFIIGAIWLISSYNGLVNLQEDVNLAQSDIEAALQARIEKIPDLVSTVKASSEHEEQIISELAQARAALATSIDSGDLYAMSTANEQLTAKLNNFIGLVEDNPELQSGEQYTALMDSIEGAVNRITQARRAYNKVVNQYNRRIRTFPGSLYAAMFGFDEIEEFKAVEEAHQTNVVDWGK